MKFCNSQEKNHFQLDRFLEFISNLWGSAREKQDAMRVGIFYWEEARGFNFDVSFQVYAIL